MIKVLIVEDSPVVQELLNYIMASDPDIEVAAIAGSGSEALKLLKHINPDVITMDMHMPRMDGYEATRRIMETHPVPVVIVSASYRAGDVNRAFLALEAGAVAIVEKPSGIGPAFQDASRKLLEIVKIMSEVRVVRWSRAHKPDIMPVALDIKPDWRRGPVRCIAIGASTGGPPVIRTILSRLPKNFLVPIFIVQHMAAGFINGMVEWINCSTPLNVRIPANGDIFLKGHVYVAPDGFQMGIDGGGRITLTGEKPDNGLRPSVSYLFRSVAKVMRQDAAGVLLTGMGNDGASELKLMKEAGAVTIVQDRESSVVFGMPGEAVKINAAKYVLSPEKIAETLQILVSEK